MKCCEVLRLSLPTSLGTWHWATTLSLSSAKPTIIINVIIKLPQIVVICIKRVAHVLTKICGRL